MLSNLIFRISNLEWTFWTFVCCQRDLMYLESLIIAHIKYIFWQARSIGGGGDFYFLWFWERISLFYVYVDFLDEAAHHPTPALKNDAILPVWLHDQNSFIHPHSFHVILPPVFNKILFLKIIIFYIW